MADKKDCGCGCGSKKGGSKKGEAKK